MWQNVTKIISLLLCAAMLLCFCGCSNTGSQSGSVPAENRGTGVKNQYTDLFTKKLVVENNITIESICPDGEGTYNNYLVIDGLKNEDVEAKINARFSEVYNEMAYGDYIPPYRGIRQKLRSVDNTAGSYYERSISMDESFNCNNILSVTATCSVSGYGPDEDMLIYYSYTVPMNFDLSTGDELVLSDLFFEDTDYIELLSKKMDEYIMLNGFDNTTDFVEWDETEMQQPLSLVSPFTGIKPEQKFYVSYAGGIVLLLDFDTPEFVSDLAATSVNITLTDGLALSGKKAKGVYENDRVTYNLMMTSLGETSMKDVYKEIELEGYHGSVNYRYSTSMSQPVIDKIEEIATSRDYFPMDISALADDVRRDADGQKWDLDLGAIVYFDSTAEFINLVASYYASSEVFDSKGEPSSLGSRSVSVYYSLKDGNTEPVVFSSLFRQPEKATELAAAAIEKKLVRKYNISEASAGELAAAVAPHINGVCVYSDALNVSFDIESDEMENIVAGIFGASDDLYGIIYNCSELCYHDLGCENLTLFD